MPVPAAIAPIGERARFIPQAHAADAIAARSLLAPSTLRIAMRFYCAGGRDRCGMRLTCIMADCIAVCTDATLSFSTPLGSNSAVPQFHTCATFASGQLAITVSVMVRALCAQRESESPPGTPGA